MTAGVGQHPALYSTPSMPPETRKWEAAIKANESILKEKELVIERYTPITSDLKRLTKLTLALLEQKNQLRDCGIIPRKYSLPQDTATGDYPGI